MPTISIFFGIIIRMYREINSKHNLPLIQAEYQDFEAVISIDGDVLGGSLPPKKLKLVQAWIVFIMKIYKQTGNCYQKVKSFSKYHH